MERNAHYLIVGIFIASAFTVGLLFLIWIADTSNDHLYKHYAVYFDDSVSGLSEGSKVKYRGVNVGRVSDIGFDPNHPERIKTIIEVEPTTPISTSSTVSIKSVGITGLSELAIKTKDALGSDLPILNGEKFPVIKASRSNINKLLEDAPRITDSASEALSRINRILNDENIEHINNSLDKFETISNNIELISTNLSATINDDNAKTIANTLQNLNRTTRRIDTIVKNNKSQIERFTGDDLDEMTLLIKEAREMVKNYKILGKKLADDPSQILYQPNYEGVKVKK